MAWWWKKPAEAPGAVEARVRYKYANFRELLSLNNECLELISGLQEDLQFVPPLRDILGTRIGTIYEKLEATVATLEKLTGLPAGQLRNALHAQQDEVERYIAARQELANPDLSAWLADFDARAVADVGSKAAALAEIRNKLHLPVPEGYVLTAQAYRQFCGVPLWAQVRDLTRNVDLNDLDALQTISAKLNDLVLGCPVPRGLEVAITGRAHILRQVCSSFAIRSSAVGEGAEMTFAGQFVSLINVPPDQMVESYKQVVAGRFSERALFYRLSAGLPEVETPMAVLFLGLVRARASGIMYTRDPNSPADETLWITATRGLGLDIASGRVPADLFVLDRKRAHPVLEQSIVSKEEEIVLREGGGLDRRRLPPEEANAPSLGLKELALLAEWGIRIEKHFKVPQDIEWALDEEGELWILQSRPLVLTDAARTKTKSRVKEEPLLAGGRTVYPGRVSGKAYLAAEPKALSRTPEGAILFLRRATPEIVEIFPRIGGLVAEWGNIAGHAAALLREAKIPAVFQMPGAFDRLHSGDAVSLDAVQPRVYAGSFWPARAIEAPARERQRKKAADPINERLLNLHLLDPAGSDFRASGCKSAHDVLRFCHEKAIETMFALSDTELERGTPSSKKLVTQTPMNVRVLDLGGGVVPAKVSEAQVAPEDIISRPFRALWRGINHPGVTWKRELPASLGDLASVMASALTEQTGAIRALGESSYLLVADEYMNLNSRLAYHFTLVDACLSGVPGNNYISFRFAGGGAAAYRRDLRARFIEACLTHFGFTVDRRGDLVNAWYKKAPAEATEANLDLLGRLMVSTSQLDMYMTSQAVMMWYVQQFLDGNYSFSKDAASQPTLRD
jgi:pyruvate,water dikinase